MLNRIGVGLLGAVIAFAAIPASASTILYYSDFLPYLGVVSPGSSIEYTHTFQPEGYSASDDLQVTDVTLTVGVVDDLSSLDDLLREPEYAQVELNGIDVLSGQATLNLLFKDVTLLADIQGYGDSFDVRITSTGGDFAVLFSNAGFDYSVKLPAVPVPEPSAALAFAVGALVVGAQLRRRA
jgi:hypothetical protein